MQHHVLNGRGVERLRSRCKGDLKRYLISCSHLDPWVDSLLRCTERTARTVRTLQYFTRPIRYGIARCWMLYAMCFVLHIVKSENYNDVLNFQGVTLLGVRSWGSWAGGEGG